jgi:hypothetical protein
LLPILTRVCHYSGGETKFKILEHSTCGAVASMAKMNCIFKFFENPVFEDKYPHSWPSWYIRGKCSFVRELINRHGQQQQRREKKTL